MVKFAGNTGFSIPELIMASVVVVLILVGIIAVHIMLQTVWVEEIARMDLQSKARGAMDRMARGAYGQNGMREAAGATVSYDNTAITYTSGIDGTERSFYLDSGEVMFDPDTSTSGNEFSIAENISGLVFSYAGGIVTVKLNMEKEINSRTVKVDLSTKVRLRNVSS